MKTLVDAINEAKGATITLSEKEAEFLLGCLLNGYEAAERDRTWNSSSILNKNQAKKFFSRLVGEFDKSCSFVQQHQWNRDIEKNMY